MPASGNVVTFAMYKAVLAMLMAIVSSGAAAAAWVEAGGSDIETFTSYADLTTIRKSGNMVKMWSLLDYETVQVRAGKTYMSIKAQFEYDCKEERARVLYYSWHSKNMGGGDVVAFNSDPLDWSSVAPGAITETLWKLACGKHGNPV